MDMNAAEHGISTCQGSDALVIGVTGHRTVDPGDHRVNRAIRRELYQLACARGRGALVLCSLAQGADQMVASAALEICRARLIVPLPAQLPAYRSDFTSPPARFGFEHLFARASAMVAAPDLGNASREGGYAWAGAWIAARADVLVAVWDGGPARGEGGTADVVRWFLSLEVPQVFQGFGPGARRRRGAARLLVHVDPAKGSARRLTAG